MTDRTASHDRIDREPSLFAARLTPHRSLSRAGFVTLMAALGGVSFAAGMVFLLMGAWPVFGFFGLDVLLVYWAFRANYRAAAAYEDVMVTTSELRVRKVTSRGQVSEWVFNPMWSKLEYEADEEFGLQRALPRLARPQAADRGLSATPGKSELRGRPCGSAGRSQAWTDPYGFRVNGFGVVAPARTGRSGRTLPTRIEVRSKHAYGRFPRRLCGNRVVRRPCPF